VHKYGLESLTQEETTVRMSLAAMRANPLLLASGNKKLRLRQEVYDALPRAGGVARAKAKSWTPSRP